MVAMENAARKSPPGRKKVEALRNNGKDQESPRRSAGRNKKAAVTMKQQANDSEEPPNGGAIAGSEETADLSTPEDGQQQQNQQQNEQEALAPKLGDSAEKPARANLPSGTKVKKHNSPGKPPAPLAKQASAASRSVATKEAKQERATQEQHEQQARGAGTTTNDDEAQQQRSQPKAGAFNANAYQLLKIAKASHVSGDNPMKAIDFASRAATLFEKEDGGEQATLELVLCLHIVAAGYCRLKKYEQAIEVLESSLLIPNKEQEQEYALAVFASHMQLGDTFSLAGKYDKALASYHTALDIQKQVLGESDLRVAETCRYLSEAHLQAMQFDEAQRLCEYVLDIHRKQSAPGSIDEAIDRKLMALIHSGKGEHEMALENLVLASTTLSCSGRDTDVAAVDCSIGEAYFALGRYDEAVFSYQKALTVLKAAKGDSHASVAAVYVSLADLYLKAGKQREAKTYCENALRILGKQNSGHAPDELSTSLAEIAAVFETMGERDKALALLRNSLDILQAAPGEQSAAAGVEAQMGVLYYVTGKYSDAYNSFKNAALKLKHGSDKETVFLGLLFHQMGLASVEVGDVPSAVEHLEEARRILSNVSGAEHQDTLAVCSNLAGCYDALGRVDDAIDMLERVVEVREEGLGTVHPDVIRDRERLMCLLKDAGRRRTRKTSTLEELLLLPKSRHLQLQQQKGVS